MLSGIREGFFYRGLYFLLPENFQDTASFMTALRQAELPAAALAVVLKEDSEVESTSYELGVCIAPYFISEGLRQAPSVRLIIYAAPADKRIRRLHPSNPFWAHKNAPPQTVRVRHFYAQ